MSDPPASGGTTGSGGTTPSGGTSASGAPGTARVSDGGATPPDSVDPVIPELTADCPTWASGIITFMGLDGIRLVAGAKPVARSAPMLFYWHGTASTSDEYMFLAAPVVNGVTAAGGVTVSFQGTTGGGIFPGNSTFGEGDLTLVDQLVACAVRDHNVDPRRIYTIGCSGGGLFSTAMAALRSQYVAAVAPNSGGEVMPVAFQNEHTPALMTVHGQSGSDVVVLDFSEASMTADRAFKARGGFVIDCDTGGGHCGGAGLAVDVWRFFQAHPFGVSPEPWASGLPAGFSSKCTSK
jgi:hypothetical protein